MQPTTPRPPLKKKKSFDFVSPEIMLCVWLSKSIPEPKPTFFSGRGTILQLVSPLACGKEDISVVAKNF